MKASQIKKWLLPGFLLLLVIIYFLPITVSSSRMVVVHLPYQKTLEQLTTLGRWPGWWPEPGALRVSGDTVFEGGRPAYILQSREMLSLVLANPEKTAYHVLTVVPATYDSVSTVQWKRLSYLRTAVNERVQALFGRRGHSMEALLQSFRKKMEDPVSLYGFPVSIVPVEDTFIIVRNAFTTRDHIPATILATYGELRRCLDSLHYTGRAERMLYLDSSNADSVEVIAGFSLGRPVNVKPPFRLMTMPKAHIVMGEYNGDYAKIGDLHKAMEAFMTDQRISPVAIAYEKMLSDPKTARDSTRVRVRVFYPSYIP